uniref:NADH-ubiquinone oxidoreductase chain 4L n=1 Tax=Nesodiprion zhejiangensis TaxID=2916818 RepID=A0A9E8AHA5_9HYME|nr:NADH dehydrogenase subunit 4L [Nesodiprion zhejiangensis]UZC33517.1 NADH dehydrogenase subunit 4L [Nesodiprion zhejiangensis]
MLMLDLNYLVYVMFMLSFLSLSLNRFHLLMVLLTIEFIILILYFMLFLLLNLYIMELYFIMIFLIFSVCEGVLGLSILIFMIRLHGNDYFQVLNIF